MLFPDRRDFLILSLLNPSTHARQKPRTLAEPVPVLAALQLADEFSAAGSQTGTDGIDVLDRERDVAHTRRFRPRVRVVALD